MILKAPPTKKLASWPPYGYEGTHRCKDGDSWVTVSNTYGRADPWDIIQFNFETHVPEIVNTHMEQLLGCTKSKDGKNYSFSSADNPGVIYIPPAYWRPEFGPIKSPKPEIIKDLSDPRVAQVPYINQPAAIAIIKDKIAVREVKDLPLPSEYDYDSTLRLHPHIGGMTAWLWLVKETVHILEGPLGWQAKSFSLEVEAKSWVALAAFLDLTLPPFLHMVDMMRFGAGKQQKLRIYNAARECWLAKKEKTLNTFVSLDPIMRLLPADPDVTRRLRA